MIRAEGVVAAPTDTLVGLLALATSAEAVRRVLAIKGPGRAAPLPLLVSDVASISIVAEELPDQARRLADRLWPGPLTLVLRVRPGVLPHGVTAGRDTVGVRVPGPSAALDLLREVGGPLTGTSANRTGQPAPVRTDDLDAGVAAMVDLVLPGAGRTAVASAVVDVTGATPRVIRHGPGLDGLLP